MKANELARLLLENQELNDQVKQLVRSERRLSLSTHELERQLHRIEALNSFAFAASQAASAPGVLALAVDTLFACFPLEQGVGLLKNERGDLAVVAHRAVEGLDAAPSIASAELALPAQEIGSAPSVFSRLEGTRAPHLGRYYELMDATFGSDRVPQSPALLVLPLQFAGEQQLRALVVARRVTPVLSFLEALPSDDDLPALRLMAAHFATAVRMVTLLQESQASERLAMRQSAEAGRLYREATEAIQIRDEFLSIASHELRTPLTSLMLQIDLLPGTSTIPIDSLRRHCHRLAGLVDELLDVSRIRADRLELSFAEVDVARVARDVAARFVPDLARRGGALSIDANAPAFARCDRGRIDQAIANLLSNAIKFGRGKPITLAVEPRAETIAIIVHDEGLGIAPADQQRVFDRFERAVSERHYGGLGLGLYLTRRIVEAHGGTIRLTSELGVGSTFIVELPRMPRNDRAPEVASPRVG
jgi:signal transduction histidine kinase